MRLPKRLCGASCQRHAQEETTTALLCWCAVREEARISFCRVVRVRNVGVVLFFFVEVCLTLNMSHVQLILCF